MEIDPQRQRSTAKMASHLNKSKLGSVSLSELMFQPILFDKETDHLRVKRLFIQIGAVTLAEGLL